MTRVGDLIKTAREKTGISQTRLASYCGLTSPQYISNIETARSGISIDVAKKVIEILPIKAVDMRTAMICDYSDELKLRWGNKWSKK